MAGVESESSSRSLVAAQQEQACSDWGTDGSTLSPRPGPRLLVQVLQGLLGMVRHLLEDWVQVRGSQEVWLQQEDLT